MKGQGDEIEIVCKAMEKVVMRIESLHDKQIAMEKSLIEKDEAITRMAREIVILKQQLEEIKLDTEHKQQLNDWMIDVAPQREYDQPLNPDSLRSLRQDYTTRRGR